MARKVTIILIDSEMPLLDLLGGYLRAAGAEVLLANSSDAGLEICQTAGCTAAVIAVNPKLPDCQLLLRHARELFPGAQVVALVDSDEALDFAGSLKIDVVDKRRRPASVFERIRLAAGLAEPSHERVLVVDDEELIRDFLSTFLQTRGYGASTATDGEDALRLLHDDPGFGVVLLDIMMPQKGGMEVLSEVRRFKRRPGVIMMTALADAEIAGQALKQGAFNYLLKPLDLAELESNVSACFSHSQYGKNRLFLTKGRDSVILT